MDDVTQAGEAVETSPAVEGQEEQEVVAQDEATDEVERRETGWFCLIAAGVPDESTGIPADVPRRGSVPTLPATAALARWLRL